MHKDYYKLLGVSRNATNEEIRIAYHELAKKFHPDKFTTNTAVWDMANRALVELNEAYSILKDAYKRKSYDATLENNFQEEAEEAQQKNNQKHEGTQTSSSQSDGQVNNQEHEEAQKSSSPPDNNSGNGSNRPGRIFKWILLVLVLILIFINLPSITKVTPPAITASSLTAGRVGVYYKQRLSASGTAPITWSKDSGTLPTGLTLNSAGEISGNPTRAGRFNFAVYAKNSAGRDRNYFHIIINPPQQQPQPQKPQPQNSDVQKPKQLQPQRLEPVVSKFTGFVSGNNVNIRNGPSTKSDSLLIVDMNFEVYVIEEGREWHKIQYIDTKGKKGDGYISAQYVSRYRIDVKAPAQPKSIVVTVQGNQQVNSNTINSVKNTIADQLQKNGFRVVDSRAGHSTLLSVQIGIQQLQRVRRVQFEYYEATAPITVTATSSDGKTLFNYTALGNGRGSNEIKAIQNFVEDASKLAVNRIRNFLQP